MDADRASDRAAGPTRPGLRERKKAKTRALIQEQAVRLFAERGYDQTSVEEIAEAAEVSPSTVFRYFPTKAELVVYDDMDDRFADAFRSQPAETGVVEALRIATRTTFGSMTSGDMALQSERALLLTTVPELRSSMLGELVRTLRVIAELVAERSGLSADDDRVVALAGAVIGVSIAAWYGAGGLEADLTGRFLDRLDAGMALLEHGIRL